MRQFRVLPSSGAGLPVGHPFLVCPASAPGGSKERGHLSNVLCVSRSGDPLARWWAGGSAPCGCQAVFSRGRSNRSRHPDLTGLQGASGATLGPWWRGVWMPEPWPSLGAPVHLDKADETQVRGI